MSDELRRTWKAETQETYVRCYSNVTGADHT